MGVSRWIIEISVNDCGKNSGIWQRVTGDRNSGRRLAVGIIGRQQACKASVRLAPSWMLEIVAAAVRVPIREIRVANYHLVLFAPGNCVPRFARMQIDAAEQLNWLRAGSFERLQGARLLLLSQLRATRNCWQAGQILVLRARSSRACQEGAQLAWRQQAKRLR